MTVKKFLLSVVAAFLTSCLFSAECWEIRLSLNVPRVYSNSDSLGYRAYQKQNLRGYFTVEDDAYEPIVTFCSLENLTHKINGKNVTYDVSVTDVKWHGIGSNATGRFPIRSCVLTLVAEPSYSIGPEPTEDNSLYVTLSGKGPENYIQGSVAGQIGCGCAEYGHVSPTRIWGTDTVVDTAAVYGQWKAKLRSKK